MTALTIPLWAILGLVIALLQALRPLAQERYRAKGYAIAIGNKIVIAAISLPFVIWQGLPDNPVFYTGLAITSIMWCISDIAYIKAVEKHGAGPVSRILPGAIIISFILWFAVDPGLLAHYAQRPGISLGIVVSIVFAAWCSSRLSRCAVSRGTFVTLWPTFAAATIGLIAIKLVLQTAPAAQSIYAYPFVESAIMIAYFSLFKVLRSYLPGLRAAGSDAFRWRDLLEGSTVRASLAIGLIMVAVLTLKAQALLNVDNPAYVTVLTHTDVLWIVLIYKLTGRKETGNIAAGLGIVGCAVALVLLKSLS